MVNWPLANTHILILILHLFIILWFFIFFSFLFQWLFTTYKYFSTVSSMPPYISLHILYEHACDKLNITILIDCTILNFRTLSIVTMPAEVGPQWACSRPTVGSLCLVWAAYTEPTLWAGCGLPHWCPNWGVCFMPVTGPAVGCSQGAQFSARSGPTRHISWVRHK